MIFSVFHFPWDSNDEDHRGAEAKIVGHDEIYQVVEPILVKFKLDLLIFKHVSMIKFFYQIL